MMIRFGVEVGGSGGEGEAQGLGFGQTTRNQGDVYQSGWIVLDYGDIVVHVMTDKVSCLVLGVCVFFGVEGCVFVFLFLIF